MTDYYRILHVRPDAPVEVIRSSYRALMQSLKLHPDLGGDHDRAAQINEAYAVLSDPGRRACYDREIGSDAATAWLPDEESGASCLFCDGPHPTGTRADPDSLCIECGSPLRPAERQRLEPSMRRMLRRFVRQLPVEVYAEWPAPMTRGLMRDLSLNGMRFTADVPFEPDRLVKIECELCSAVGRVTHCGPDVGGSYSIGIEFVTLRFAQTRGTFVSAQV